MNKVIIIIATVLLLFTCCHNKQITAGEEDNTAIEDQITHAKDKILNDSSNDISESEISIENLDNWIGNY